MWNKLEKIFLSSLPPLDEDNDLDFHYIAEDFFTTLVCWLAIILFGYLTSLIFDLMNDEDYTSFLHHSSFVGSSPFVTFSDDWDIIYEDVADDDLVNTYEEDDYFNVYSSYEEVDGYEEDVNLDVPINVPFFEAVYNSGELVERIHWAFPLGTLYAFRKTKLFWQRGLHRTYARHRL